jgi:hypothetical protein
MQLKTAMDNLVATVKSGLTRGEAFGASGLKSGGLL